MKSGFPAFCEKAEDFRTAVLFPHGHNGLGWGGQLLSLLTRFPFHLRARAQVLHPHFSGHPRRALPGNVAYHEAWVGGQTPERTKLH